MLPKQETFGVLSSSKQKKNPEAGWAARGADLWASGGPAEEKKNAASGTACGPALCQKKNGRTRQLDGSVSNCNWIGGRHRGPVSPRWAGAVGPWKKRRLRRLDRWHTVRTCGPAVMSSVLVKGGANSCKDSGLKAAHDLKPRTLSSNSKRLGSSQSPLLRRNVEWAELSKLASSRQGSRCFRPYPSTLHPNPNNLPGEKTGSKSFQSDPRNPQPRSVSTNPKPTRQNTLSCSSVLQCWYSLPEALTLIQGCKNRSMMFSSLQNQNPEKGKPAVDAIQMGM